MESKVCLKVELAHLVFIDMVSVPIIATIALRLLSFTPDLTQEDNNEVPYYKPYNYLRGKFMRNSAACETEGKGHQNR